VVWVRLRCLGVAMVFVVCGLGVLGLFLDVVGCVFGLAIVFVVCGYCGLSVGVAMLFAVLGLGVSGLFIWGSHGVSGLRFG
jgi:hypothetical protein